MAAVIVGPTDDQEIRTEIRTKLKDILMLSEYARTQSDYDFLDKYIHSANYFSDLHPSDRHRYLRAVKGIEIQQGEELFHIGDYADAFYCVMYGSLNVVIDFTHMAAPTLNDFDEIMNRARIHSCFLNPGGNIDALHSTSYVVRTLKALECFGDVGLLTTEKTRTASVIANETTLLMKIDKATFIDLRSISIGRELRHGCISLQSSLRVSHDGCLYVSAPSREKTRFLENVVAFAHWDNDNIIKLCGRMERLRFCYNEIVVCEGDVAGHFYFVKHGECRLVKYFRNVRHQGSPCFVEISTVGSRHYFGAYEVINGLERAAFSILISSPSATLYRVDRIDFRQTVLKDSLTEQMIRSECKELGTRIQEENVRKDLMHEVQWNKYKQNLVLQIIDKHEQEHTGPAVSCTRETRSSPIRIEAPSSARRPDETMRHHVLSPRSARAAGMASKRASFATTTSKGLMGKQSAKGGKWQQWAVERAQNVLSDFDRSSDATNEALASNIEWSRISQIMGGITNDTDTDKVTSAIVSFFNDKGNNSS